MMQYNFNYAPVAQWIEYLTSNQLVARSSRAGGANYKDLLVHYLFNSLDEDRRITFDWLDKYNSIRPHASLGNEIPYEYSSNRERVYL